MWADLLKTILLLGSLTGSVISMEVECPQKMVNGTVGETITLSCKYKSSVSSTQNLVIRWSTYTGQNAGLQLFYMYQGGQWYPIGVPEGKYEGISTTTATNASIFIRNAEIKDTGIYVCEVSNVPDVAGTLSAHVFAYVRGKPSKTTCSKQEETHENVHWVYLSCSSEALPRPTYEWWRIAPDNSRHIVEGQMDNRTGILNITDPQNMMTGVYRCIARNEMGEDTCDYEEKKAKVSSSSSTAIIIGVVFAVIILSVVIGVTVWFVLYKKKKSTKTNTKSKSSGSVTAVRTASNYSSVTRDETLPVTSDMAELRKNEESTTYNQKSPTPPPTNRTTSIELEV